MRKWYRFEAKAEDAAVDIYVYDEIGKSFWNDNAVSAATFIADLKALPASVKTIKVHINCPGGSVFEALAIANAIRAERVGGRVVETIIDGLAASAATIVSSAGQPITIADNAMMMIHEPEGIEIGSAGVMRKMADVLDAVRNSIIATYQWVSDKTTEELSALMVAETWFDATEAVANGFATTIAHGKQVTACFRPDVLARLGAVPEKYRAAIDALIAKPEPKPEQPKAAAAVDVMRFCREGGCSDLAEGLVTAGATLDVVTAKVAEAKQARQVAAARATEITALCAKAKLPELAAGYITGAMSSAAIRSHLTTLTAKLDAVEIDGGLAPSHGSKPKPRIDVAAVYAARNGLTKKE